MPEGSSELNAEACNDWNLRPYEEWTNLHLRLLWCYDSIVEPYGRHSDINAKYLTAWLVRSGNIQVRHRRGIIRGGPGMWVIPEPGLRRHDMDDHTGILSIGFSAHWPDGTHLYQDNLGVVFPAVDHPHLEKAARPLLLAYKRYVGSGFLSRKDPITFEDYTAIQSKLPAWIKAFSMSMDALGINPTRRHFDDDRIVRTLRFIDTAPMHEQLTRDKIASAVGLSPAHLDRLFLQAVGHSIYHHCEQRRLIWARESLSIGSAQIKEVAICLGFKNPTHFTRWFRQLEGLSPTEFRAKSGW